MSSKILFKLTGSIACYKACQVISKLVQLGHEVQVVGSPSATRFVGSATIEGLTGKAFITDLYEPGQNMAHIHLMRWADLIVVAPASAHFINRIAKGVGDDLLSTLFLAHDFKKPYLIAPAMNTSMYLHPTTQSSLQDLKKMGIEVLETASGVLACGETGWGRLLEPELLLKEICDKLPKQGLNQNRDQTDHGPKSQLGQPAELTKAARVLITAGGTAEPIDAVRMISNRSTGATGRTIAAHLIQFGFDVHFFHGLHVNPVPGAKNESFESFSSYHDQLQNLVNTLQPEVLILAAAVSDFSVAKINGEEVGNFRDVKLSSADAPILQLKKNPKIINLIRKWGGPKPFLVGFKMTSRASEQEVKSKVHSLIEEAGCNLVVHNDTQDFKFGETKSHPFKIFSKEDCSSVQSSEELALALSQLIAQHLSRPGGKR